jgi:predicted transcriptional regulator
MKECRKISNEELARSFMAIGATTLTEKVKTWKERIKQAGYTQEQFIAVAGVSRCGLANVINNRTRPTAEFFDRVEGALRKIENSK